MSQLDGKRIGEDSQNDVKVERQESHMSRATNDMELSAELVVLLRSFRWVEQENFASESGVVNHKKQLHGRNCYAKVHVGQCAVKSDYFTVESDVTNLDFVLPVSIEKRHLKSNAVLKVKLKSMASNSIRLARATHGEANIRAMDVANAGSPENFAFYPISAGPNQPPFAELEMAIYWCLKADVPSASSPRSSTNRKRISFPRSLQASRTYEEALGLFDLKKDIGWVSNTKGVADSDKFSKLIVRIVEAKGLQAADSNGYSDPYCIVACRGHKFKTKVIGKSLSPVWDEEFRFNSLDGIDPTDEVSIIIRDKDVLSRHDDLGCIVFPIWALRQQSEAAWFELSPTPRMKWDKSKPSLGWIRVQIIYRPKVLSADVGDTTDGGDLGNATPPPEKSLSFPDVIRTGNQRTRTRSIDLLGIGAHWDSGENMIQRPILQVRVIQARNIPSADADGFSDPYCLVKCKRKEYKTRVVKDSLCPKWNQLFEFGEKDYIAPSDTLSLTIVDYDLGLFEGVTDDKLGQVEIPLYELINKPNPEAPVWYPLESDKYLCPGEVQVAVRYTRPSSHSNDAKARALYKGKDWLYELQLTVESARNLVVADEKFGTSDPYCIIKCGAHKNIKTRVQKRTTSPIWHQHFKFRKSVDISRGGLGRMDMLRITVMSQKQSGIDATPLGKVEFDLGQILDKLGYVDKQGATLQSYFPLSEVDVMEEEADGGVDDDGMNDRSPSPSSATSSSRFGRFNILRRIGSGEDRSPRSPGSERERKGSEYTSGGDDDDDDDDDNNNSNTNDRRGADDNRSVHEKTMDKFVTASKMTYEYSRKLSWQNMEKVRDTAVATVGMKGMSDGDTAEMPQKPGSRRPTSPLSMEQFSLTKSFSSSPVEGTNEDNISEPFGAIRLKIKVVPIGELSVLQTTKLGVRINRISNMVPEFDSEGGQTISNRDPRIPTSLYASFTLNMEDHLSPHVVFRNHSSGVAVFNKQVIFDSYLEHKRSNSKSTPASGLVLRVFNATDYSVVASGEIPFSDVVNFAENKFTGWCDLKSAIFPHATPKVELQFFLLDIDEVMKPLLGHFHISLLSLKIKRDEFDRTFRTVIRHKDRVISTRSEVGNLSISYPKDTHTYAFPVYDMYSPVHIEVWCKDTSSTSTSRETQLRKQSKWGKLFGSVTISTFDMLELEAQIVYSDSTLLREKEWPRIKLPILNPKGKEKASLWVEARYSERIAEVLKPNPNPTLRPLKPYNLANIRHELNRTAALVSWLTSGFSGMGHLLNWENKSHTFLAILVTVLFCCVDVYSERLLILPIYYILFLVVRKHHERMDGKFLQKVLMDVNARDTRARLRIAVIKARGLPFFDNSKHDDDLHGTNEAKLVGPGEGNDDDSQEYFSGEDEKQSLSPSPTPSSPSTEKKQRPALKIQRSKRDTRHGFRGVMQKVPGFKRSPIRGAKNRSPTGNDILASGDGSRLSRRFSSNTGLPFPRVKVGLRKLGSHHVSIVGQTRTHAPSICPDFSSSSQGYTSYKSKYHGKLIDWETSTGMVVPGFQADIHLTPITNPLILLHIYRAEEILEGDTTGFSDPYTVVQVVKPDGTTFTEHQTKTAMRTLNPRWNQEFILGTHKRISMQDTIRFMVWDFDITSADDELGMLEIPVREIVDLFHDDEEPTTIHPIWFNLQKPPHFIEDANVKSFGRILLSMQMIHFSNSKAGENLLLSMARKHDPSFDLERGLSVSSSNNNNNHKSFIQDQSEASSLTSYDTATDSWYRCDHEIVFEVENVQADSQHSFLGTTRLPIAALITNEENLKQPLFEKWLPLSLRFDGGQCDAELKRINKGKHGSGEILVRVELVLPDPQVRQKMMELEEAKRADSAKNPIAKIRMINQRLEDLQTTLYNLNNKLEHLKNLLNWSHPRKTKVIFNVLVFLAVLFTLVPTRFIIMFVALFMFTEHFRPLGTMSLRFNHLLALLPTDDDLRDACEGKIVSAKRKKVAEDEKKNLDVPPLSRFALLDSKPTTVITDEPSVIPELENASLFMARSKAPIELSAEDIASGFTGHLRILLTTSSTFSLRKTRRWVRMYCFTSSKESALYWWSSKEKFEEFQHANGSFENIVAIETNVPRDELHGCERPELAFAIYKLSAATIKSGRASPTLRDNSSVSSSSSSPRRTISNTLQASYLEKVLLIANSVRKKNIWIQKLQDQM